MNFQDVSTLEAGISLLRSTAPPPRATRRELPRASRYFMLLLICGLLIATYFAAPVGKLAAIAAAVLGVLGWSDGAIRHLAKLFGLLLAAAAAPLAASMLGPYFAQQSGMSLPIATVAAGGAGFALALVAVLIVAQILTAALRGAGLLSCLNHISGGLLGAAEGALLVAVGVWLLGAFEPTLTRLAARAPQPSALRGDALIHRLKDVGATLRSDAAGAWLLARNPLPKLPVVRGVNGLLVAVSDPMAFQRVLDDPRILSLIDKLKHEASLLDVAEDAQVRGWVEQGDLGAFLNSPQFAALAGNGQLLSTIRGNWQEVMAALADAAPALSVGESALTGAARQPIIHPRKNE